MEGPKQDTEAGIKLLSKLLESRAPRWNYVAIFARDEKGEPQYRFIGKPVSQIEHEVIFKDQDGQCTISATSRSLSSIMTLLRCEPNG
jgi:hypothetical protein